MGQFDLEDMVYTEYVENGKIKLLAGSIKHMKLLWKTSIKLAQSLYTNPKDHWREIC